MSDKTIHDKATDWAMYFQGLAQSLEPLEMGEISPTDAAYLIEAFEGCLETLPGFISRLVTYEGGDE